jgi:hypothetical protein
MRRPSKSVEQTTGPTARLAQLGGWTDKNRRRRHSARQQGLQTENRDCATGGSGSNIVISASQAKRICRSCEHDANDRPTDLTNNAITNGGVYLSHDRQNGHARPDAPLLGPAQLYEALRDKAEEKIRGDRLRRISYQSRTMHSIGNESRTKTHARVPVLYDDAQQAAMYNECAEAKRMLLPPSSSDVRCPPGNTN